MEVDREAVKWAYRILLNRDPESEDVVTYWTKSVSSIEELRSGILGSEEYSHLSERSIFTGYEAPIRAQIDTELGRNEADLLFEKVKSTWTDLGQRDPLWAVLSAEEFHNRDDAGTISKFYASGAGDIERIKKTLARNGIKLPKKATVLEYGCGVGRITSHLAREFNAVIGVDISKTMLDVANEYMRKHGITNVSFRHLNTVSDINALPSADLFYSVLVFQHSPPPIISQIVRSAVQCLNQGGVALFQVPIYLKDYDFTAQRYLSGSYGDKFKSKHKQWEIHAIRQKDLFSIIKNAGGSLIEVVQDSISTLGHPGIISNTLLVGKM